MPDRCSGRAVPHSSLIQAAALLISMGVYIHWKLLKFFDQFQASAVELCYVVNMRFIVWGDSSQTFQCVQVFWSKVVTLSPVCESLLGRPK
jgi:hypothetical protein